MKGHKPGPRDQVYEKPEALLLYEMVKETGLPVWKGALMDQPHIWLLQFKLIDSLVKVFDRLQRQYEMAQRQNTG